MKRRSKKSKSAALNRASAVVPVVFTPKNLIGPRVAELREKAGLRQGDLAIALTSRGAKVDRVQMNRIEVQKRYVSDVELVAISAILGVSPLSLLGIERSGTAVAPATSPVDSPSSVPAEPPADTAPAAP